MFTNLYYGLETNKRNIALVWEQIGNKFDIIFRSQEKTNKSSVREQNQTGPVNPRVDELVISRNQERIGQKLMKMNSNTKLKHFRHSSMASLNNQKESKRYADHSSHSRLSISPSGHLKSSNSKSPASRKKSTVRKSSRYQVVPKGNKTRVKKFQTRATRLSPRSWIKKKNSIHKQNPSAHLSPKMSTIEEKKRGLESIASRLSLVSIGHPLCSPDALGIVGTQTPHP